MKVETVNKEKFTPIEIKLTIESEEELCNLWHRTNLSTYYVDGQSNYLIHGADDSTEELWKVLHSSVTHLNLKK